MYWLKALCLLIALHSAVASGSGSGSGSGSAKNGPAKLSFSDDSGDSCYLAYSGTTGKSSCPKHKTRSACCPLRDAESL
jgi:hypothetical protein